jgi:4'-phosphopantetheinyl transferase
MSVAIYWLSQKLSDVPDVEDWLSAGEATVLAGMRFAKRRNDWRLGRWTAKCAIFAFLGSELDIGRFSLLEIRSARDGAPEALFNQAPAPISLSISHSAEASFCAVAMSGVAVGCDIELVEQREPDFFADYFTADEMSFLTGAAERDRALFAMVIWSAKESALKSLREGLRRDTRSVDVRFGATGVVDGWNPLSVRCHESGRTFEGWWRLKGRFVQTLTADQPSAQPVELHVTLPPIPPGSH